jgi:hypothetical protein
MPDDLAFEVAGSTPQGHACEVWLIHEGRARSEPLAVSGEFNKAFYVSFCASEYTVQAVCNGDVVYSKSIVYPAKGIAQPYHIGKLKLKTEERPNQSLSPTPGTRAPLHAVAAGAG